MSRLMEIRDSAQHTAAAIAAALGVEVAIIDPNSELVASSKGYVNAKGAQIYKPYIEAVIREKVIICKSPGHFIHCTGCRLEGRCPETAEVQCAIDMDDGETLGVISLAAFDEEQRYRLLGKTETLLEFINEMGKMLISKVREREAIKHITQANRLFETTLDSISDGIITFDWKGTITHTNRVACRLLGVESAKLIGEPVEEFVRVKGLVKAIQSGIAIQHQEYIFTGSARVHCFISAKPIYNAGQITGAVLSLSDIRDVRSVVNQYTGMQGNTTFDAIIGNSEQITALKEQAFKVAHSDSTILIQGESGTGKEIFARAIHSASPRGKGPFIAINCGAIPEMLLESELFGYEQGAFTGAKKGGKPGKFELADGGTLFLDEIGDMPLHLQVKLLRVLEERSFERVGGTRTIPLDVRIIAATNQDLEAKLHTGEFRKDLFYRLNVIPLFIPPLCERKQDIIVLSNYFLENYSRKLKKAIVGLTPDAEKALQAYSWPGNVRELENAIEYAINVETGSYVQISSLPRRVIQGNHAKTTLRERVKQYERAQILEALARHGWGVKGKEKAAKELGISVPSLYRKLMEEEKRGVNF